MARSSAQTAEHPGRRMRRAALVAALAAGVWSAPEVSAQQAPRLLSFAHVDSAACRGIARAWGVERFSRELEGHAWPPAPGSGIAFIHHTAGHLNAAAIGRGDPNALADRLLTAVRGNAFTSLDFGARGGSSPSFVSAILVKSVAYAVAYLRAQGALSGQELGEIVVWVERLQRNARKRAGSRDHKAALATADLMWAAALGDPRRFEQAQQGFFRTLSALRRAPRFAPDLRNNNEVMHQVVAGAQVLWFNGLDVLRAPIGSHTLNEAVRVHAREVRANGARALQTSGDPTDQARSIFRAQGWGTHLAWIPVYLSFAPPGAAREEVRRLESALRRVDRKPFWGRQMGVHTGCLFGG